VRHVLQDTRMGESSPAGKRSMARALSGRRRSSTPTKLKEHDSLLSPFLIVTSWRFARSHNCDVSGEHVGLQRHTVLRIAVETPSGHRCHLAA
jgi:hypothetical protein